MLKLIRVLIKLILICLASFIGLVAGAFIFYGVFGSIYLWVFGDQVANSYECARGYLVGWLILLAGAATGASIGGYGAFQFLNPPAETID